MTRLEAALDVQPAKDAPPLRARPGASCRRRLARCAARAPARYRGTHGPGSGSSSPALRPALPWPTRSASSTIAFTPASAHAYAVAQAVRPPPTITTSVVCATAQARIVRDARAGKKVDPGRDAVAGSQPMQPPPTYRAATSRMGARRPASRALRGEYLIHDLLGRPRRTNTVALPARTSSFATRSGSLTIKPVFNQADEHLPPGVAGGKAEHAADAEAAMMLDEFGEKRLEIGSKRNRHASSDCKLLLLLLQQPAFSLDAPAVAAEAAVLLHDAVARDDEADVIGRACPRDGAGRRGAPRSSATSL